MNEDIPAFLRRARAERPQPWAGRRDISSDIERPHPRNDTNRGPGSVARRLGYPEAPEDALARAAYQQRAQASAEAKKQEGLRALAAWKAEQAAERAEMAAVRNKAKVQNGHNVT